MYEGPERRADYMTLTDDVKNLKHTIYGNGKPGLAEQYRALFTMVETIKLDIAESKSIRKQIVIGVVVGVVLAGLNLIITLVQK
jgi:hypothetical protein